MSETIARLEASRLEQISVINDMMQRINGMRDHLTDNTLTLHMDMEAMQDTLARILIAVTPPMHVEAGPQLLTDITSVRLKLSKIWDEIKPRPYEPPPR